MLRGMLNRAERFVLRELIQNTAQRLMEFDRQAIDPGD